MAAVAVASCSGSTVASPSESPASTPSVEQSSSPSPSASPQPFQRREASLPAPVEETAAAAAGGRLYVMGGLNAAGQSLNTVYVFDGVRWAAGPTLPLPLDHASAAALDDRVYIAGGHSNGSDSARLFRLDGDRWTALASLRYARGGHTLLALDGKLYAIGGNTSRLNVPQLETYDPAANSWSVVASLPQPRNHVLGFVLGAAVCAAGGRSPTTSRVDCYDTRQGLMARQPNVPFATSGGGAITFGDLDTIVLGGQDAAETRIVDAIALGSGGTWKLSPERMLMPRHGFELAIFNGRAWACGGGSAPGLHPVATCTSLGDPASSKE